MPGQVIPIQDIAKLGVVRDTPSVSLPPNVFSNVSNVRFDDSAVQKMEGEEAIIVNVGAKDFLHVAWWAHPSKAPNSGYYVVVARDSTHDYVYLFDADDITTTGATDYYYRETTNAGARWQHTFFGGGNTIILNDTQSTPVYLTDPDTATDFLSLPGWDSYLVEETVTSVTWDGFTITDIDVGQRVDLTDGTNPITVNADLLTEGTLYEVMNPGDMTLMQWMQLNTAITEIPVAGTRFEAEMTGVTGNPVEAAVLATAGTQEIIVTITHANPEYPAFTLEILNTLETAGQPISVTFDEDTGTHYVTPGVLVVDDMDNVVTQGVAAGDTVTIAISTIPEIRVRAGIIRTFGNLLIAGNLTEVMRDDPARVVRNMPGLIRTSDVAVASSIPANWNPFRVGVNTADEFTLSSTGIVQDMAELQGTMFVYTNNSIHSIQATGNAQLPYNVRPVTRGYGAQTYDAVVEFDGKHVVVGSNDIYVFAGHPGSIQSISDGKVRKYLFDNLNPDAQEKLHMILNRRFDELWLNFPSGDSTECNTTLVWNYRENHWTIREMSSFENSVIAPKKTSTGVDPNVLVPLMVSTLDVVFESDADRYLMHDDSMYTSFIERRRLALSPEFDTETLMSIAMLVDGGADLQIAVEGTGNPGAVATLADEFDFNTSTDYKTDIRVHGRFLNYRISETGMTNWRLTGMQFEIGKGGQR